MDDAAKRAAQTARRRAAKQCITCGDPAGNKAVWDTAAEKWKVVTRATCVKCGQEANARRAARNA